MLELGICIIDPNVRGSDGYGKTFVSLDNGEKREDSVRDIGALLDWVAEQRPESGASFCFDASRVAVWGGSYGGYMCLASLIHFADRLCAGVDMVGISNFVTFLENTSAYRRDLRRQKYGDEREPKMRALLEQISPLTRAHEIRAPLFIAQARMRAHTYTPARTRTHACIDRAQMTRECQRRRRSRFGRVQRRTARRQTLFLDPFLLSYFVYAVRSVA